MRPKDLFMHRNVIEWVICGGQHCRRGKMFQTVLAGNLTQVTGFTDKHYHVAVKADFYRKTVEVCFMGPVAENLSSGVWKYNKGPDQPAHRRSLISAFVIRLYVDLLTGWFESLFVGNTEDRFSHVAAHIYLDPVT